MTLNYADRLSYSLLCRLRGAEGMYPDPLKGVRLDVDRRRINYGDPKGREEGGYELTVTDTDGQQYRVSVERPEPGTKERGMFARNIVKKREAALAHPTPTNEGEE